MSGEILLHIEGGGGKVNTTKLRKAFNTFFGELRHRAKEEGIRLRCVPCGDRRRTFKRFRTALKDAPNAINFLLVDSEGPVAPNHGPWEHLRNSPHNQWDKPSGADDTQCHLMVQMMEAWLMADREALKEYYGKGFRESALPANRNVEEIPKDTLLDALDRAARDTPKKRYRKPRDGPGILEKARPDEVRSKARHCDRLFSTILAEIGGA